MEIPDTSFKTGHCASERDKDAELELIWSTENGDHYKLTFIFESVRTSPFDLSTCLDNKLAGKDTQSNQGHVRMGLAPETCDFPIRIAN